MTTRILLITLIVSLAVVAGCSGPALSPQEKSAYLDKIQLNEVRDSVSVTGQEAVVGKITNAGNRSLAAVTVTIDLLDENGRSLQQLTHSPVSGAIWPFGDKALSPNGTLDFRVKIQNAPRQWSKDVRVKVVDFRFK